MNWGLLPLGIVCVAALVAFLWIAYLDGCAVMRIERWGGSMTTEEFNAHLAKKKAGQTPVVNRSVRVPINYPACE